MGAEGAQRARSQDLSRVSVAHPVQLIHEGAWKTQDLSMKGWPVVVEPQLTKNSL